jgi:hypothetical protein
MSEDFLAALYFSMVCSRSNVVGKEGKSDATVYRDTAADTGSDYAAPYESVGTSLYSLIISISYNV